MINLSIQVPVLHTLHAKAADSFNFIDTYVELVTEVIFNHENAIPENKHRHHHDIAFHTQAPVICEQPGPLTVPAVAYETDNCYPVYSNHYRFQFSRELKHPPSSPVAS